MTEIGVHAPSTACASNGVTNSNSSSSSANFTPSSKHASNHAGTAPRDTNSSSAERHDVNGSDSKRQEHLHKLPKLPVADLEVTLDKYLSLIRSVVSAQDYVRTKFLVEDFCKAKGIGHQLQAHLLKRQQEMDNWVNDWWLRDMYLNVRLPLLINSNAAAMFPYQSFPSRQHQIRFAAKFISGILDFKRLLDTRTLPVDRCKYKEKGQPMCMDQHYKLFTSYRQPGRDRDLQSTNLGTPGDDYIVVVTNNQLSRVMNMADTSGKSPAVGLLTSQARNMWAESRERLLQDITNRSSLYTIENCVFVVCLDQPTVPSYGRSRGQLMTDLTARTHHIIHGQGSANNTGNRWMDKTIQLIVSESGTCGINMEHSVAEGIALQHMIEHAMGVMYREKSTDSGLDAEALASPDILRWNLSMQSMSDIRAAGDQVDRMVDDFDLSVMRFDSFGRDFIKGQNISPDAFIQLALQLTYYKIHGSLTSTYESAGVRRFRQGRVDVIRANSLAALKWIKAMVGQTENTEEEKLQLLTEAVRWQQDYTLDTILGSGIDLHMLGLREAAVELDIPTPEIFKDPSYIESNTFRLSTSQVPAASDCWMGYGAVVPDGYGCCYNPHPSYIIFSVGAFFSCQDTSSDMFANSLESSLLQMSELCTYKSETADPRHRQT